MSIGNTPVEKSIVRKVKRVDDLKKNTVKTCPETPGDSRREQTYPNFIIAAKVGRVICWKGVPFPDRARVGTSGSGVRPNIGVRPVLLASDQGG